MGRRKSKQSISGKSRESGIALLNKTAAFYFCPMINVTTAMILAAGKGTRMGPLTRQVPKPMLPVRGKPILEHIVRHLATHGIRKIVINVHYLPDVIVNYFGDGSRWGVTILYSRESQLLETGGGVANARPFFPDETVFLANGDVLCDVTPQELIGLHALKGARVTLTVLPSQNYREYSLILYDRNYRVVDILPKGTSPPPGVSSGIYTGHALLHPRAIGHLNPVPHSIVSMLFKPLIETNGIYVYPYSGKWIDFGTREKYTQITNK